MEALLQRVIMHSSRMPKILRSYGSLAASSNGNISANKFAVLLAQSFGHTSKGYAFGSAHRQAR